MEKETPKSFDKGGDVEELRRRRRCGGKQLCMPELRRRRRCRRLHEGEAKAKARQREGEAEAEAERKEVRTE